MTDIDVPLVRRLITAQFPRWADLPVRPVDVGGWDNRTFRLGDELSVRLPSAAGYVPAVEKEQRWLPYLAPRLPLPVPVPVGRGVPGLGYPFPWSVYRWIEGTPVPSGRIADPVRFATDLAGFLVALRRVDPTGGPVAGPHSFWRGGPLEVYDAETRQAIERLGAGPAATAVWEDALAATWTGPPVWFHGDVAEGNLLLRDRALAAVIDFGTCGVGDPSSDLRIAWTLFSGPSRDAFRAAVDQDDATWTRARGWTLWKALITADRPESRRVLAELLAAAGRLTVAVPRVDASAGTGGAGVRRDEGADVADKLVSPDPSLGGPDVEAAVENAESGTLTEDVHHPPAPGEGAAESRLEQMRDVDTSGADHPDGTQA